MKDFIIMLSTIAIAVITFFLGIAYPVGKYICTQDAKMQGFNRVEFNLVGCYVEHKNKLVNIKRLKVLD